MTLFSDRFDAGRRLAQELRDYAGRDDVLVLALPRGGVAVGYQVAMEIGVPLDVFLVRKLGVPGHEELAMGAVASGDVMVLNQDVVAQLNLAPEVIDRVAERERRELRRRQRLYRRGQPPREIAGKVVILVDDGLATGATMRAATQAVRQHGPKEIVVAVPTAEPSACAEVRGIVDRVVCLATPTPFLSVGAFYGDFGQVTDDQVRELLARASAGSTG